MHQINKATINRVGYAVIAAVTLMFTVMGPREIAQVILALIIISNLIAVFKGGHKHGSNN